MNHYAIDQWVDFKRGLLPAEDRTQMQGHLQNGCRKCRDLSDLTSSGASMAANPVPQSAGRLARTIFPGRVPDRQKRGNRLPVELIFDSFMVPSPAGLRASWQVGWQALYRAGDCSVDLRIEPLMNSPRAAVIGQIVSAALPALEMANLPVCLRAGKAIAAETSSNRFGEFQMEYDQRPQLILCIRLRDSKSIQVPLKRLISEPPVSRTLTSSLKQPAERQ